MQSRQIPIAQKSNYVLHDLNGENADIDGRFNRKKES
jgi:hypothetical protein